MLTSANISQFHYNLIFFSLKTLNSVEFWSLLLRPISFFDSSQSPFLNGSHKHLFMEFPLRLTIGGYPSWFHTCLYMLFYVLLFRMCKWWRSGKGWVIYDQLSLLHWMELKMSMIYLVPPKNKQVHKMMKNMSKGYGGNWRESQ